MVAFRKGRVLVQTLMLAILVILILPSDSAALDASDLKFTWAGNEIEYISFNNPVAANLEFKYTLGSEEVLDSILVDAGDMNSDIRVRQEYSNIEIVSCPEENGTRRCNIPNKVIRTSDDTIEIILKFKLDNGTIVEKTLTKTFTVDNTRPNVVFLGPQACDSTGKCFVAANTQSRIKIQMEDSVASFNRKRLAFKLGQEIGYVHSCEAMTCYGYATAVCTSNQQVPLIIAQYNGQPSQDDAGNALTGMVSTTVTCDSQRPQIISQLATSSSGLNAITVNDVIKLRINATEETSTSVNLTVNGDPIGVGNITGSCNLVGSTWVCTADITPAIQLAGQYTLQYVITDLAGNAAPGTITISLLSTDETQVIDFWKTKKVTQSNNAMERQNLQYARTFFVEVELEKKRGTPELVNVVSGTTCEPATENRTGNKGDIAEITLLSFNTEKNKLYYKLMLRQSNGVNNNIYSRYNSLEYNCGLQLISKSGTILYSTPENDTFPIKITLNDGKALYTNVEAEINATRKRMEDLDKGILKYKSAIQTASAVCRGIGGMQTATATVAILEEGLAPFVPFTTIGAIGAGATSDGLNVASNSASPFLEFCKILTCQSEFQTTVTGVFDDYLGDYAGYLGYNNFSASLDPHKSKWVAYGMLCIPEIIYHQEVQKGIECTYLDCLETSVSTQGATPAACVSQKQFSECVYSTGGLLDTIPVLSAVRDASARLGDILSNPIQTIGVAAPFACLLIAKGTIPHAACNIYIGVTSAFSIFGTYANILAPAQGPSDHCAVVEQNINLNRVNPVGNFPVPEQSQQLSNNLVKYQDYYVIQDKNIVIMPILDYDKGTVKDYLIYQNNKNVPVNIVGIKSALGDFQSSGSTGGATGAGTTTNPEVPKDYNYNFGEAILTAGQGVYMERTSDGQLIAVSGADKSAQVVLDYPLLQQYGIVKNVNGKWVVDNSKGQEFTDKLNEIAYTERKQYEQYANTELGQQLRELSDARTNYMSLLKDAPKIVDQKNALSGYDQMKGLPISEDDKTLAQLETENPELYAKIKQVYIAKIGEDQAGTEEGWNEYKNKKIKDVKEDELLENRKDALEEDADKRADKIEDAYDDMVSEANDVAIEKRYNQYFGSFKSTVQSAWGAGAGLGVLRNLMGASFGGDAEWWQDSIGALGRAIGSVATFERDLCSSDIDTSAGVGETVVMNQVGTGTYRNGAYISARRSGLVEAPNGTYYDYFIAGSVNIKNLPTSNARLVLIDSVGRETDYTQTVFNSGSVLLMRNTVTSIAGNNYYSFTSTQKYSKICWVLGASLNDLFDYVEGNGGSNRICQTIMGEEYE